MKPYWHCYILITAAALLGAIFVVPDSASAQNCRLCSDEEKSEVEKQPIPLHIEIMTNLNFSRAALSGNGSGRIAVSEHSGQKRVDGQLVDLGGYAVAGSVFITGEPGRSLTIDMPNKIIMRSNKGGQISIHDLRTDLSPAPRLDNVGELRFSFGGDLVVDGNVSGRFRGRIPITVNYE